MSCLQVDAQLQVVRKLEEKERLLQGTINTAERELALRTQALDMNKRKVRDVVTSSELRLSWPQQINTCVSAPPPPRLRTQRCCPRRCGLSWSRSSRSSTR